MKNYEKYANNQIKLVINIYYKYFRSAHYLNLYKTQFFYETS